MWLPSCPLRQKKSTSSLDFHLSNPAMFSETLSGFPQISEKKVPLIPLGVMGWAGTEGQNGLPESGLEQRGRMGCLSQTELSPDPGSTVIAVRPWASPSPRTFLIWEIGVFILLFSPFWPLLLVMCRIEMVFSTLPLCCVGVNSSGSTANSLPMLNPGFCVSAWQGKRALSLCLCLCLCLSLSLSHTHTHTQEHTLTFSSSLAPSGWITGREKRAGSRRELPGLILLQDGFLKRQKLF